MLLQPRENKGGKLVDCFRALVFAIVATHFTCLSSTFQTFSVVVEEARKLSPSQPVSSLHTATSLEGFRHAFQAALVVTFCFSSTQLPTANLKRASGVGWPFGMLATPATNAGANSSLHRISGFLAKSSWLHTPQQSDRDEQ